MLLCTMCSICMSNSIYNTYKHGNSQNEKLPCMLMLPKDALSVHFFMCILDFCGD